MIIDLLKKAIPEYTIKLPDENKKYSYRPMLVKEEKFISVITNINSSFEDKITNLCNLVNSCFDNKLEAKSLSITDFQIALNAIRQKSISEIADFQMKCPETGEQVKVHLNLESFTIHKKENSYILKLDNSTLFKFESPKVYSLMILENYPNTEEDWFKILCNSLIEIETEKEKLDLKDTKIEDKISYIELLPKNEFANIKNFIRSNSVSFKINYRLSNNTEKEIEVNDFVNFLKFFLVILTL